MPALAGDTDEGGRFIVKSVSEHSSLGLDASSVVKREDVGRSDCRTRGALRRGLVCRDLHSGTRVLDRRDRDRKGCRSFAAGRDPLRQGAGRRSQILDYASKWEEGSNEFARTPRQFLDAREEAALVARVKSTSRSLWEALGLRGYARFDYRLSRNGKLFLIDVNANPCLSSDAGFMAAAEASGRTFDETIAAILEAALLPFRAYPPLNLPDAPERAVAASRVVCARRPRTTQTIICLPPNRRRNS